MIAILTHPLDSGRVASYDPWGIRVTYAWVIYEPATERQGVMAKVKKKKTARKKYTKKNGVNRSEAIRNYVRVHTNAGPTEVKKELAKKGVTVSTALVSNVKARMSDDGGTAKKGRRSKTAEANKPLDDVRHAGDLMFQAVQLVLTAGAREAKHLVGRAEEMVNAVRERK